MGRNTKQGIDYFPLDVQFDGSTELYLLETEADGLAVLITIWQLIYSNEGYYIIDNKDLYLLIKKRVNLDIKTIQNCIHAMLERGLIDNNLHKKYSILTSTGIQKRYFEAAKRKKEVKADPRYFLLESIDVYGNIKNVHINDKDEGTNATNVKEEEDIKEEEEGDVRAEQKPGPRRMQKNWQPDQESIEWIQSFGVTLEQAKPTILEFINYWTKRTTRRKGWDKTFRNSGPVQASLLRINNNGPHKQTHSKQQQHQTAGDLLRDDIRQYTGQVDNGVCGENEGIIQGEVDS
jgi:hypothetical protein